MATATGRSRFLDLRALAALEHMRFCPRQRLDGPLAGRHASRRQGGSGEFVDYRQYSDGEDLRRVDWKVLSRTGRAYVRLYQDDTNVRSILAIDGSGSMAFGGHAPRDSAGSKLEYSQFFTSALAQIMLHDQGQVGLAVLADELHDYLPPGGTVAHLARVHESIEAVQPRASSQMAPALRALFHAARGRAVLLVASDFLNDDLDDAFATLRLFRHRRWEVIAIHLIHPQEMTLPEGASFQFEGMENEGRVNCSPADIRDAYQQRFDEHLHRVRSLALSSGFDYRRVLTSTPYLRTLADFLVERSG